MSLSLHLRNFDVIFPAFFFSYQHLCFRALSTNESAFSLFFLLLLFSNAENGKTNLIAH